MTTINTLSILGCGWYGFPLAERLIKSGFEVKGSCTSAEKIHQLNQAGIKSYEVIFQNTSESFDPDFFKTDLVIITIPPKVNSFGVDAYLNKIQRIKEALIRNRIQQVLYISSTGVYGDSNEEVDEDTLPAPDSESGKALLKAEQILSDQNVFTLSIIRFAGLIGPGRNPGKFFAGKKNIPNGLAPVNLIHLDDCIGITLSIIEQQAFGLTFNACSSDHPSRQEFYTRSAQAADLEVPEFISELKTWKIVSSKYLYPLLGYTTNKLATF